jgi:hypothetical protein
MVGVLVMVGTRLGTALVLGALLELGSKLGSKLGTALGFELGSNDVLGLELGKELGSSLGGKITVATILWSSSSILANTPDDNASSFFFPASLTSMPLLFLEVNFTITL